MHNVRVSGRPEIQLSVQIAMPIFATGHDDTRYFMNQCETRAMTCQQRSSVRQALSLILAFELSAFLGPAPKRFLLQDFLL